MNETCGCCKGMKALTPMLISNRPGQNSLMYRAGTHASFLMTMKAGLPSLKGLTVRSEDDPSLAFMDAWATVADVLTFYQERIANEGYLRTASERCSVLELARLVGYKLRPGVASSVYLAFTLDKGHSIVIQKGVGSKTVPGTDEMPQTFETSEALMAKHDLNTMSPRSKRPQFINEDNASTLDTLYIDGISTNLKANDRLLLILNTDSSWKTSVRMVEQVDLEPSEKRTMVGLQLSRGVTSGAGVEGAKAATSGVSDLSDMIKSLLKHPSIQPASSTALKRDMQQVFGLQSDIGPNLLSAINPTLGDKLYTAISNAKVTEPSKLQSVNAMRIKAMPFGHNAPLKPILNDKGVMVDQEEWPLVDDVRLIKVQLTSKPSDSYPRTKDDEELTFVQASFSYGRGPKPSTLDLTLSKDTSSLISLGNIDIEISLKISLNICCKKVKETYTFKFKDPKKGTIEIINIIYDIIYDRPIKFIVTINFGESPNIFIPPVVLNPGKTERISSDSQKVEATYTQNNEALSSKISITDELQMASDEKNTLFLDAQYDKIVPGSFVVVERPKSNVSNLEDEIQVFKVKDIGTVSKAGYGITATVTRLDLEGDPKGDNPAGNWLKDKDRSISVLRNTTIYAQSEPLELSEEQIDPVKEPIRGDEIELDRLYSGLEVGRWIIVSGERLDIPGTSGVKSSELVMIAGIRQDVAKTGQNKKQDLPGDKTHTFIKLAENGLAYIYKRDTVTIYGNVAKATHGETRNEILGSGDGSKIFQMFALRQSPLTYLASAKPEGMESTLEVTVNDIVWHEKNNLFEMGPKDRAYTTVTDDNNKTTIIFGDGEHGALLPTDVENVKAVYRTGIGSSGNAKAEQVRQLASRPLGLKDVINPIWASGGAERETLNEARQNVPSNLIALGRLVSVKDYADFANAFPGIGKANAKRLSDGQQLVTHITIAVEDDIPIDKNSDLYRNLSSALSNLGDINIVKLDIRELLLIIIKANVKLQPDYLWDSVEPKIRAALLETFSFDNRDLGEDVLLSEVISIIQNIEGVSYVDVDILDCISEKNAAKDLMNLYESLKDNGKSKGKPRQRIKVDTAKIKSEKTKMCSDSSICPAQLAILSSAIHDTIILEMLND